VITVKWLNQTRATVWNGLNINLKAYVS